MQRRKWDLPERATGDQKVVLGPAGFAARFFAGVVDGLLMFGILALLFFLLQAAGPVKLNAFPTLEEARQAGQFLLVWAFASVALIGTLMVATEAAGGTPGKRLLGIRAMSTDGETPGVGLSVARLVVWLLTWPVSMFIAVVHPVRTSLSDLASNTYVVRIGERQEWVAQNMSAKKLKAAPVIAPTA
jgi:uncharacterized RDD family membrane protein YckC